VARTMKGRLFRRRKGGAFYVQYSLNGRMLVKVLRDEHGQSVTTLEEATKARDLLLAPYLAKDVEQRRRQAVHALEDIQVAAARAAADARPRLKLAEVWDRHPYTHNTPKKHKRTVRNLTAKSVADNRMQWEKFTRWVKEKHPDATNMEDVTEKMARQYSEYLRNVERLTANRHNKLIRTASVMFRLAGRPDSFANVDHYHVEYHGRVNLERDELLKVCQSATGELKRLLAIGLYSGMRLGDCVTLDWRSNVHLDHNRLIRKTGKTGAVVSLPLHPELRAVLEEVPERARRGAVCPELAATYAKDPAAVSKLVQRHFEAAELKTQEERDGLKPARQRGKDEDGKKVPKPDGVKARCVSLRGFHSLRHSFVTLCAQAGVPIGQIREWVGHASPKITEIYQHWSHNDEQDRTLTLALPAMNGSTPKPEPERGRLAERALTAPIEKVRKALRMLEA